MLSYKLGRWAPAHAASEAFRDHKFVRWATFVDELVGMEPGGTGTSRRPRLSSRSRDAEQGRVTMVTMPS